MNHQYVLKDNKEIETLVHRRQSVSNKYFVVYWQESDKPAIAISISKKNGDAVYRNYRKRRAREIIRRNLTLIGKKKMLIIIKKAVETLSFPEEEEQLVRLIRKAGKENK